jgi:bacterial/archaeal transporter family protein
MGWLTASLLALTGFGLWGFFSRLAVDHIDAASALVYQTAGVFLTGLLMFFLLGLRPATDWRGNGYAILTGIAYGVGCLFYFYAVQRGKVTTVVTLTALYPLLTIMLSWFFLQESVSFRQWMGIFLALAAILLMSM